MLQTTISVGPLAPGAFATISHGLKDTNDRPLAPKQVMPSKATPIAVVGTPTTTQVVFQNQGPVADTATFECICPHSVQQSLSDPATCYWRGASSLAGLPSLLGVDGAVLEEHPVGTVAWRQLDDGFIVGGFRVVATINARNAIPASWRKQGMLVYVVATATSYQLEADLTTWAGYNLTGGTASNVMLAADPAGAPVTHTIYARPTGSDLTGDGTVGNPYATFTRVLRDVPIVIRNAVYVVDVTGVTEALPDGWSMPPFSGSSWGGTDMAPVFPGFYFVSSLMVRAIPNVVLTIPAANIISQLPNATTGLITVHTNLALTAHALKGKLIGGGSYELAVVVDNTTTDIETTSGAAFSAGDLIVATQSATLSAVNLGTYMATVQMNGLQCSWQFQGIKITATDHPAAVPSVVVSQNPVTPYAYGFFGCDLEGLLTDASANMCFVSGCHITSLQSLAAADGGAYSTFFDAATQVKSNTLSGAPNGGTDYFYCVAVGGDAMGMMSDGVIVGGNMSFRSCEIRDNSGPGISVCGVDRCTIKNCNIHNNGASGVLVDSTKYLKMINVDGAANTGYGLEIKNGSTVSADAACSVTGTVEAIKVGAHAAESWATWASGNQTDLLDAGTQICRLGTT